MSFIYLLVFLNETDMLLNVYLFVCNSSDRYKRIPVFLTSIIPNCLCVTRESSYLVVAGVGVASALRRGITSRNDAAYSYRKCMHVCNERNAECMHVVY